jgi:hypothetical protein
MAHQPVPVVNTSVVTPPPLFNGQPKQFPVWLEHFSAYVHLTKVTEDTDKRAVLVCSLSPVVQQTLIALIAPKTIRESRYEELLARLEKHYKVTPIMLAEYFKYFTSSQPSGMTYSEYAIHLRTLAADCAWPIDLDRALAVQFVMGIQDDKLRQQMLQRDHASLDNALTQAKQFESILRESSRGGSRPTTSSELSLVNQVRSRDKGDSHQSDRCDGSDQCDRCGGSDHKGNECKHRNTVCNACSKTGHLARVCKSRPDTSQSRSKGKQHHSQKREQMNNSNRIHHVTFDLDVIHMRPNCGALGDSRYYEVALQINGRSACLKFDSGAAVTMINKTLWHELGRPRLKESTVVCRSFTGQQIPVMGQVAANVIYNGKSARLKMLVSSQGVNLLGRSWIRALQITDLNALHTPESTPINALRVATDQIPAPPPPLAGNRAFVVKSATTDTPKRMSPRAQPQGAHPSPPLEVDSTTPCKSTTPTPDRRKNRHALSHKRSTGRRRSHSVDPLALRRPARVHRPPSRFRLLE